MRHGLSRSVRIPAAGLVFGSGTVVAALNRVRTGGDRFTSGPPRFGKSTLVALADVDGEVVARDRAKLRRVAGSPWVWGSGGVSRADAHRIANRLTHALICDEPTSVRLSQPIQRCGARSSSIANAWRRCQPKTNSRGQPQAGQAPIEEVELALPAVTGFSIVGAGSLPSLSSPAPAR